MDKDWLELPSAKDGEQYLIVPTSADDEPNYTLLYDKSMLTPLWSAYPLNSSHIGSGRSGSWSFHPNILQEYQVDVTKGSYSGSTYSRGHLCPNGSRSGNNSMQAQTFYVTNQVPQIQNNFNGGIWSQLENAVRDEVSSTDEIYVVTGVAFHKEDSSVQEAISYISPGKVPTQQVPIPNYFYKVILKVRYSGSDIVSASTIGFWFEHKTYSGSYTNYTASVDQIEEWTGFDFFVNLPVALQATAETNTSWNSFSAF